MSRKSISRLLASLVLGCCVSAAHADEGSMSTNSVLQVLPAPGAMNIDGKTDDWDLTAGVWSYNNPTLVDKYSLWTHLMWDDKGVYMLARYHDLTPLQNAARGKDFQQSWRADAFQARVIFDDQTDDEHQMHINMFYSTQEQTPYLIVKHGGFKAKPPYDGTGPDRPDQLEKYGPDMLAKGGKIAFKPWDDNKGYNMEVFWPWSYVRTSGKPLAVGEKFTFGIEAMWGNADGTKLSQRLADGVKDEKTNRIFMFRARDGWGKAVIADKGKLAVTDDQKALQARRLKQFVNYDTAGTAEIAYTLPEDREVTIAIDNLNGQRVRNLFGQYPRSAGQVKDLWDGLDDNGKPVAPGTYNVTIVDHKPISLKLYNSLYNSATPPWTTETGSKLWGSNHGEPTSASVRGETILLGFTGTEGCSGIMRIDANGKILWADTNEFLDIASDDTFAYGISRSSWQKKTLVMRYRLTDGQIMPFDDADKSPNITILPTEKDVPNQTSMDYADGKLVIHIPGQPLFVMDPKTGAITGRPEIPNIAAVTARKDKLYVLLTDGTVALYDTDGKQQQVLLKATGVQKPTRLGIRHDLKEFAISDGGTNQVLVFDAAGKQLRAIGTAYAGDERPAGKFVSTDLIKPMGLDYDNQNRLWLAEASKFSKRITLWDGEGKLLDQFWGSADYGAMAGFAVTNDSTRFIAHAVEFKLDPNPNPLKTKTNEQPLIYHPELKDERGFVYTVNGVDYACGAPGYNKPDSLMIARRGADGVFHPAVRVTFPSRQPKGVKALATAWTDLNADGKESPDEITKDVDMRGMYWSNGWVRPDLTIFSTNSNVFPVKSFTKDGVPVYDFANPVKPANALPYVDKGSAGSTPVIDNAGNISTGLAWHMVDGRRGTYPNRYGRHDAPAAQRGRIIAPFRTNGVVEDVPGVGSITAIGGDRGEWFLMSMDGLYLSSILQDSKGEITLDDTFVGQESFGGFLWRDEKDRVVVQLGGPSYRLMEVLGLETVRKNSASVTITQEQIDQGVQMAAAARREGSVEPDELTIAKIATLPTEAINPDLGSKEPLIAGVPDVKVTESGNPQRWFRVAMAHDSKNLVIAYQVADSTPWKNAAGQFTHAFIGGDCVDLKLDVPGRGPVRLLAASVGGKNTAVYWQKKAKEKDNPITYSVGNNVANAESFDIVRRAGNAKIVQQSGMAGYTVLMTIPLADLGLDAKAKTLRGVAGVIYSDASGTNRAARMYWSDKSTDLVSDVPTESRINVSKFGKIVFAE